jgi:hypothetical protein
MNSVKAWFRREVLEAGTAIRDEILQTIRQEYTVMPRFMFHQPLDYSSVTFPKKQIQVERQSPLIPDDEFRFGYSLGNSKEYLAWGSYDYNMVLNEIK